MIDLFADREMAEADRYREAASNLADDWCREYGVSSYDLGSALYGLEDMIEARIHTEVAAALERAAKKAECEIHDGDMIAALLRDLIHAGSALPERPYTEDLIDVGTARFSFRCPATMTAAEAGKALTWLWIVRSRLLEVYEAPAEPWRYQAELSEPLEQHGEQHPRTGPATGDAVARGVAEPVEHPGDGCADDGSDGSQFGVGGHDGRGRGLPDAGCDGSGGRRA